MSMVKRVIQAVQSWRHRRGAVKPRKRFGVGLEQLDHRQLLAVNFTGVVATDFPATTSPGVVYLSDPNNAIPTFPTTPPAGSPPGTPSLQQLIRHSGFEIDGIAVNYDSASDTLSFGLVQPFSGNISANGLNFPVISGDADNNGNNGTVNPLISDNGAVPGSTTGIQPGFRDYPGVGGTESMGVFLDLAPAGSGVAANTSETIIAGIPPDPSGINSNNYQVAQADYATAQVPATGIPNFGAKLTNNLGGFSLINSPANGAFEFSITHFSQIYKFETGQNLTATSQITVSGFGGSSDDFGTEEFFHAQTLNLPGATTPIPPVPVPPVPVPPVPPVVVVVCAPVVYVNPHQNRHVNSAHYDNVRVTVLSSSSFDATSIIPSTVRLGGATPYTEFSRDVDHNGLRDETFVFRGIDINLPPGVTTATLTGTTNTGTSFSSSELIFNKNDSYYSASQISARDARLAKIGVTSIAQEVASLQSATAAPTGSEAATASQAAATQMAATMPASTATAPTTVTITPRETAAAKLAARREALMSPVAATAFQRRPTITATKAAPTSTRSLATHDAALAGLFAGTAK